MFRSEFSGKMSDPGVTPIKVVTHKRKKVYHKQDGSPAYGWEIVKEILVLPEEVEAVKAKFGDGVFV